MWRGDWYWKWGAVFGTCHMRLKKCGNSRVGVDPRILFWQAQDGGLEGGKGSWVAVSALNMMYFSDIVMCISPILKNYISRFSFESEIGLDRCFPNFIPFQGTFLRHCHVYLSDSAKPYFRIFLWDCNWRGLNHCNASHCIASQTSFPSVFVNMRWMEGMVWDIVPRWECDWEKG